MIESFKILTGKYDRAAIPVMQGAGCSVTRGHDLRLLKYRTKYDLCKYYFTSRVVNVWNSLPSFVASAVTVNCRDKKTVLRVDSTNLGKIRKLFMTNMHTSREPETEVK